MSGYREFLSVEGRERGDVTYAVGFHPDWDALRLTVSCHPWEDDACVIEVFLSPSEARDLSESLLRAAEEKEQVLA